MTPSHASAHMGCSRYQLPKYAFLLALLVSGSAAFGSRHILSVSLDGGSPWTWTWSNPTYTPVLTGTPVSVVAGQSISVSITVVTDDISPGNDDWESVTWQIASVLGSGWTCVNTEPDLTNNGTATRSFTMIAPATAGTYNAYFRAHDSDSCSNTDPSPTVTLKEGVTVLPPATNPSLDEACGLDIVLVLDSSGSIGGQLATVKAAADAFVDAFLPATPTLIGLVDFDQNATVLEDLTNNTTNLHSSIAGLVSDGYTNWEDAIQTATGLLEGGLDRDDAVHPDLIVIVTDGDPTASSAGSNNASQPNVHLYPAVLAANAAKTSSSSEPIRIVAIGVGAATQPRLVAISGSNVHPPSPLDATTDVVLGDFSELADLLSDLALSLCGGTISVHKIIDTDGNLGTPGDQYDGVGWTFTATPEAPDTATPPFGATDGMGAITFDIDLGANAGAVVDIVETVLTNYNFMSASCVNGIDRKSVV